jgi:hypothetical protein
MERSEGVPELALVYWPWSVLGPHGIRNRWFPAVTSGQCRRTRLASHKAFTALT